MGRVALDRSSPIISGSCRRKCRFSEAKPPMLTVQAGTRRICHASRLDLAGIIQVSGLKAPEMWSAQDGFHESRVQFASFLATGCEWTPSERGRCDGLHGGG